MKRQFILITALIMFLSSLFTGCGEYAAKGAGEGAAVGGASGAVSGLVGALVFGGDPVEAAARGAVYGSAAGATAGAIGGSQVDKQIQQQRDARAEKIRAEIGDDAFHGLSALITCDHQDALSFADKAKQSSNPNYALSGYWLELLSYADMGDSSKTADLIPVVTEKDWNVSDASTANKNLLELQSQLMAIREEYKRPKQCE
jgi:hypothetical protein